jgi:hypothetical protein
VSKVSSEKLARKIALEKCKDYFYDMVGKNSKIRPRFGCTIEQVVDINKDKQLAEELISKQKKIELEDKEFAKKINPKNNGFLHTLPSNRRYNWIDENGFEKFYNQLSDLTQQNKLDLDTEVYIKKSVISEFKRHWEVIYPNFKGEKAWAQSSTGAWAWRGGRDAASRALAACESKMSALPFVQHKCVIIKINNNVLNYGEQNYYSLYHYKVPTLFAAIIKKHNRAQLTKQEKTITNDKKVEVAKVEEPKLEEFKPENKDVDNQAPIIEVAKNLKFESQTFKFKGRVKDKNKFYLTANGRPVKTDRKGRFEIEGFVIDPEQGEQLQLVAIDQWNNRSEQTVNIEVEFKQVVDARSYEKPNPNKVRVRNNDNKVGIIIGIEKYQTLNNVDAPYANRDANAFRAYANRALGIPNQNLKVLIDNKATRAELLKSLKIWLPQVTRGQQKDVYIFFAGHGLASDDGKDLHILPQDGDPILLEDTAISRVEMFELINKVNPNSVTMFFDTCYSGQTRSEQMLVAGLRPVRIVANDQEIPNNYTIFTASDNDETSGSIEQAEHGIFSYYLMKGLEGNADLNKDKTLTNGELIAYLKNNVSQEAFSQNRQQEPMLSGNPDNILIRY